MKLQWIIIAEGFGTASNGAVTAIGINQHIVISPTLPVTTKRGVLAHFIDADLNISDKEIEVSLTVSDPDGKPILANTVPARISPVPQWQGISPGVDFFLEIPLRISRYGSYEIILSIQLPGDEPIIGRVPFYVEETPPAPKD
jgi:hypothetical protein